MQEKIFEDSIKEGHHNLCAKDCLHDSIYNWNPCWNPIGDMKYIKHPNPSSPERKGGIWGSLVASKRDNVLHRMFLLCDYNVKSLTSSGFGDIFVAASSMFDNLKVSRT